MPFNRMKKLQTKILAIFFVLLTFNSACFADTFKHNQTGELLHGYATSQTQNGKTIVHTQQKGIIELNLAQWQITTDHNGRNNKVIVITLDGPIMYEIETAALEQAITKAADKGPLFILLEIDTPGGRTDFAQRMCAAITDTRHCPVIAFIKGGDFGGAISAGVAVAFACNKIYMANNTIIGGATGITLSEKGPKDLKEVYGEDVGEKFSSIWRANLASLAEQNYRPGLLARAMVDKDIEVVEVSYAGKRLFIDPVNKKPKQKLVHTWSKKGSLLTLTAAEALQCMVADKLANSRQEVLRGLNAADAKVVTDNSILKARTELKRARGQLSRIKKSIDLKVKESQNSMPAPKVLNILRKTRSEFKTLIRLAKKYPDLQLDIMALEDELNSIEADYKRIKIESAKRK